MTTIAPNDGIRWPRQSVFVALVDDALSTKPATVMGSGDITGSHNMVYVNLISASAARKSPSARVSLTFDSASS